MKFLVGLGLADTDAGALRFGSWLRAESSGGTELEALHVLARPAYAESAPVDAILSDATYRARRSITEAGADSGYSAANAIIRDSAEVALVDEVAAGRADGLVIGRRAKSGERRLVHLGRVARRVLRQLPGPTIIVPPDLQADSIGKGPIMLATDLEEDSAGAARFAMQLAQSVRRPLVVAHVVEDISPVTLRMVPAATERQVLAQLQLDGEQGLKAWARDQGVGDAPAAVAVGDVHVRLQGIADAEDVALIVCGSRRLSAVARLFSASIGSSLAALSRQPVAVVPPDWRAAVTKQTGRVDDRTADERNDGEQAKRVEA